MFQCLWQPVRDKLLYLHDSMARLEFLLRQVAATVRIQVLEHGLRMCNE